MKLLEVLLHLISSLHTHSWPISWMGSLTLQVKCALIHHKISFLSCCTVCHSFRFCTHHFFADIKTVVTITSVQQALELAVVSPAQTWTGCHDHHHNHTPSSTPLNAAITLTFLLGSATAALSTSSVYDCFLSTSEAPNWQCTAGNPL
jgi:hypothetical protein